MNANISLSESNKKIEAHNNAWKNTFSYWVKHEAVQNAGRKLPKATGDNIWHYIGGFQQKAQQCISELDKLLNITSLIHAVRQMREKRDAELFKLKQKMEALNEKLMQVQTQTGHSFFQMVRFQSLIILLALLCLCCAEGFLSYRPFFYLTGSILASVVISIVFSAIWAISAHKFAEIWSNANGAARLARRMMLLLGFTLVFYIIAHLRALERASVRAIINEEPLPGFFDVNFFEVLILTAVSWLFFLGGVWLAQRSPSFSEVKQAMIQRWNKRRAQRIENEITRTQAQIDAENQKVAQAEYEVISILSARKTAVREIISYLYLMVADYKSYNTSARIDGAYPMCFDTPVHFDIDVSLPNIHEDFDTTFSAERNNERTKIS